MGASAGMKLPEVKKLMWEGGREGREKEEKNYVNSVTYYNIDKHRQLHGKFNVTLSASR